MYEYKFITIPLSTWSRKPKEDYHRVIEEYAANGWRLVQIFAPAISGYGAAKEFELIFERKTS